MARNQQDQEARVRNLLCPRCSEVGRKGIKKQEAEKLAPQLIDRDRAIRILLDGRRYIRNSNDQYRALHKDILRIVQGASDYLIARNLPEAAASALAHLRSICSNQHFDKARKVANAKYVTAQRSAICRATRDVVSWRLNNEQTDAIATDEDVTLVLAGAGAGKTAVIIGKIAHLVRNQMVEPKEILALAFNRKAAKEIRERLPKSLGDVKISTFHAFGSMIIGNATGKKPSVSKLAEDPRRMEKAITAILREMLSKEICKPITEFLAYQRTPYESPFDFPTKKEYNEHLQRCELRTLSGDLVKSLEEVQIANFLSLNGVDFKYEEPYPFDTATPERRQYRPDFYLTKYNIFIEHFALDEKGNPPPRFDGYKDGVDWKRKTHKRCGTTLIETFSWECHKEMLWFELKKKLRRQNVELHPMKLTDLLKEREKLDPLLRGFAKLLITVIKHFKTTAMSKAELRRRAGDSVRNHTFLDVFEEVLNRYQKILDEERAIDFEDMINSASNHIQKNRCLAPYRYVLVDEFQDISAGRMGMIAALNRAGLAYFVVGDDWQSIYRFAGSDVRLLTSLGQRLGYVCNRSVGTTFRYSRKILKPTAAFIQRNPKQTQRTLRTESTAPGLGIKAVKDYSQAAGVILAIRAIQKEVVSRGVVRKNVSVLVLGRYRHSSEDLDIAKKRIKLLRGMQTEFSTVHKAKGLEADYVLVLDLKNHRYGFPSMIEDDPLIELVLSPSSEENFPHAEERRLFYVATTRAKRAVI